MVVAVSDELVAEHGADGVVADVVGHADAAAEQLDGLDKQNKNVHKPKSFLHLNLVIFFMSLLLLD